MKSQKIIYIISLTYLLILFPVNLMSQDLFTAKEELTVFKKASINSDSIYRIDSNDEVEVLEIKSVWLKKWAKIQNSTGEQGYVLFHSLKPIDTNQETQENNTAKENASTQNAVAKEDYLESQKEKTQDLEQEGANTSHEYTERNTTLNNEQDNSVSQTNEKSNKSFPTWGWFAILGTIVLGYSTYLYNKHLYEKFTYNIFSISTIVSLLLSFGTISFLNYSINHNETGVMWGIPNDTFKFLLITTLILTIGFLYYYNLRKTNWYLAIINVIIQTVAVGVFVVLLIGWIILKILSSKSSTSNDRSLQADSGQAAEGSAITASGNMYANIYNSGQRKWEWDGTYLKVYSNGQREWEYDGCYLKKYSNGQREWEYDGCYLKKYSSGQREWEYDGRYFKRYSSGQREWEYDGNYLIKYSSGQRIMECKNFPIPVIAKAAGLI